jgi:hypothetical protein
VEAGRKNRRVSGDHPAFRGTPILAVIWDNQQGAKNIEASLRRLGIGAHRVSSKAPASWLRRHLSSFLSSIGEFDIGRGVISDEQDQFGQKLRAFVDRMNEVAKTKSYGRHWLLLEELQMSQIILSSGSDSELLDQRDFDYVLLKPSQQESAEKSWRPFLAIEYDGKQHREKYQKTKDEEKNQICKAAGLPLLRIDYRFLPPNPLYGDGKRDRWARTLMSEAVECAINTIRADVDQGSNLDAELDEAWDPDEYVRSMNEASVFAA